MICAGRGCCHLAFGCVVLMCWFFLMQRSLFLKYIAEWRQYRDQFFIPNCMGHIYSYAHNKPIVCPFMKQNEVYLTRQNLTKSCSWHFLKGRSFNAKNLRSIDQRALKLIAVKVGGLKKKSAAQPRPHSNRLAHIRDGPGSNHSQSLMASIFAVL